MPLLTVIPIIISLITLSLGSFVLFRDRKILANRIFFLITLSGVWWLVTNFIIDSFGINVETARFLSQLTIIGPAFFIPLTLYLSLVFPVTKEISVQKRNFIFAPSLVFLCLVFTKLNIQKIWIDDSRISFKPGRLYYLLIVYFIIYFGYIIYNFLKIQKNQTGNRTLQIQYLLGGILMASLIGIITNIILPLVGYSQALTVGPSLSLVFFLGMTAYAIVAKQLFGIKVILTQVTVGIIALLLFINVLGSVTPLEYVWKTVLLLLFMIFGYILIKSVIQEIKLRAELQIAYEKVKELDKSKSEFLSIASHQLRTPLTAIQGYLSLMLEGTYGKISEKAKKPLASVFRASRQLNQLVNTLLNISRIEAGKIQLEPSPTLLEEVLNNIVEEFKVVAQEKGLYLNLEIPSPLPLVPLDREKFSQIVMNIVDNSIKYTEKGGITINVQKQGQEKILIKISDTGLGMDEKQLSNIFQKFSRGQAGQSSWSSGAGLGLFVAKQFTELHKGKIWAESAGQGKGSAFYIEIPKNL